MLFSQCVSSSQSHMNALGIFLPQRTASDFENAVPSIWFQINNRNSWDSVLFQRLMESKDSPSHFFPPLTVGVVQAAFGKAIIAPELRCRKGWRKLQGFPQVCGRA